MSKRSVPRPPVVDPRHDPETIALRIHQIAATAGVLAEAAALAESQGEPLSHALYLIEECLLEVEDRVEALRTRASGGGALWGGRISNSRSPLLTGRLAHLQLRLSIEQVPGPAPQ